MSGGLGPLALLCLMTSALLFWLDLIPVRIFELSFVIMLAVSLLGSLPRFGLSFDRTTIIAIVFATIAVVMLLSLPGIAVVPFLAIALAYAQLTYVFAHGLMPGRKPILEQLIRMMAITPGGGPQFWRFVRRQCQIWTVLGSTMTLAALVAMAAPDLREAAGYFLALSVVTQLAIFILSHFYARWRYDRDETWQATLKAMCRPAIWSKLEL